MTLQHTEVTAVHLQARAGESIARCIMEAIVLAVSEDRPVLLRLSAQTYAVKPWDLVRAVEATAVTNQERGVGE